MYATSECRSSLYNGCSGYAHRHCQRCQDLLYMTGDKDFEDAHGRRAFSCKLCTDSLICADCAAIDARCENCAAISEGKCVRCGAAVGDDGRNIGLQKRPQGGYISIGPDQWVCAPCGSVLERRS